MMKKKPARKETAWPLGIILNLLHRRRNGEQSNYFICSVGQGGLFIHTASPRTHAHSRSLASNISSCGVQMNCEHRL